MTSKIMFDKGYSYPPVHMHAVDNRRYGHNGNGFIFGQDTYVVNECVKEEIEHILDTSRDTVILIDSTGAYSDFVSSLGGSVISFGLPGGNYINPFYIVMDKNKEWQLLREKTDFLISLCESVICNTAGFSIAQRNVLEYCIKKAYEPFLHSYDDTLNTYDYDSLPCLSDLFSILLVQRSSKIKELAEQLILRKHEIFRVLTAKKTGNDMCRLKSYNLESVPDTFKTAAILTIMDKIRQEAIGEQKVRNYTWFYMDGMHHMFHKPFATEYLEQYYMETSQQKWIMTGITNHTAVLFDNSIARNLIANSNYVILLVSSRTLREKMLNLIPVSPFEYQHFKSEESNFGLLYNKVNILSFYV